MPLQSLTALPQMLFAVLLGLTVIGAAWYCTEQSLLAKPEEAKVGAEDLRVAA